MLEAYQVDRRATDEVLRDLQRNFELRRLLLVSLHVLVPAFILTGVKMATQNTPPVGLELLWKYSLVLAATGVIVSSALVAHGMTRCHHGIVFNGALINWRIYGDAVKCGLNWQGVSTGFFLLAVVSCLFGLSIVVYCVVADFYQVHGTRLLILVGLACLALLGVACGWLVSRHKHAWRHAIAVVDLEKQLEKHDSDLRQLHRMNSIDDTNSDIGVVFVTALVLFSTMLTTLPDLADVHNGLLAPGVSATIVAYGNAVVAFYSVLVMFLSQSMIIRLRVAMAEHISLTDEGLAAGLVRVWTAGYYERTSMLYMMLAIMLNIFAMMLCLVFWGSVSIAVLFAIVYLFHSRVFLTCKMRREHGRFLEKWHGYYVPADTESP